jgi:hypothetical protein
LRPLFALLTSSHSEALHNGINELTLSFEETQAATTDTADLCKITNALVSSRSQPIVYCNTVDFENVIIALWAKLWPALRSKVAFRLSFSPRDLEQDNKLTLVCCPAELESCWPETQIVRPVVASQDMPLTSQLLCGLPNAAPLRQFMVDIGAINLEFKQLRLLEQAFKCVTAPIQQFDSLLSALRLIEVISPSPDSGSKLKAPLLERFITYINVELPANKFQQLRNITLNTMPAAPKYWAAIKSYTANHDYHSAADEFWISIIESSLVTPSAHADWQNAVMTGVTEAVQHGSTHFIQAIWRWLDTAPVVVFDLLAVLGTRNIHIEQKLVINSPTNLNEVTGEAISKFACTQQWLMLHGATLAGYLCATDAVQKQLLIDKDETFDKGLTQSLKYSTPKEMLDAAFSHNESRLIVIAAKEVVKSPSVLQDADFKSETTWLIWAEALRRDKEAWRVTDTPQHIVGVVLDAWLGGNASAITLIDLLAVLPVADLCHYEQRELLWQTLPANATKNSFLDATATGWIKNALSQSIPFNPDKTMQRAILKNNLESALSTLDTSQYANSIAMVTALPEMESGIVRRWVSTLCQNENRLNYSDSKALGDIINSRKLHDSLSNIKCLYKNGRADLKDVLVSCINMLSLWDQLTIGLKAVSWYEFWSAFEETAIELYPKGPEDFQLWERSGGKPYQLDSVGNGKEQWHKAMRKIKNGSLPLPSSLLQQMSMDFEQNEKLHWLTTNQSQFLKSY